MNANHNGHSTWNYYVCACACYMYIAHVCMALRYENICCCCCCFCAHFYAAIFRSWFDSRKCTYTQHTYSYLMYIKCYVNNAVLARHPQANGEQNWVGVCVRLCAIGRVCKASEPYHKTNLSACTHSLSSTNYSQLFVFTYYDFYYYLFLLLRSYTSSHTHTCICMFALESTYLLA